MGFDNHFPCSPGLASYHYDSVIYNISHQEMSEEQQRMAESLEWTMNWVVVQQDVCLQRRQK